MATLGCLLLVAGALLLAVVCWPLTVLLLCLLVYLGCARRLPRLEDDFPGSFWRLDFSPRVLWLPLLFALGTLGFGLLSQARS